MLSSPALAQTISTASGSPLANNTNCTTSGTACTITVTATTVGNGAILCAGLGSQNITGLTPTGGGTWTLAPGSTSAENTAGCWTTTITASVTSVGFASGITSGQGRRIAYAEFSCTPSCTWVEDTANSALQTPLTGNTTIKGIALTLGSSPDAILQVIQSGASQQMSSITSPYGTISNPNPTVVAGSVAINQSSGGAPTWTYTGGGASNIVAWAVAITAVSSSAKTCTMAVLGVGTC
jgi:hypothetical protein